MPLWGNCSSHLSYCLSYLAPLYLVLIRRKMFIKYLFYPKYSDTSTPYHICSKIWTRTIHYPMLCLKIAGWVANSVDPDETPHSAASHLGLYCLLRPVCRNTYGKYGRAINLSFPVDLLRRNIWYNFGIFFFLFLHKNIHPVGTH